MVENIPPGALQQTVLTIETDVASEGKLEVQVLNSANTQ